MSNLNFRNGVSKRCGFHVHVPQSVCVFGKAAGLLNQHFGTNQFPVQARILLLHQNDYLVEMLVVAVCASLSGADSFVEISPRICRERLLYAFGATPRYPKCSIKNSVNTLTFLFG